MNISDSNIVSLSSDVTLAPGQRVVVIGDNVYPVGVGGNAMPQKSSDAVLGFVNADGEFQALSFSGTVASNSGDPTTVTTYYTWNSTFGLGDGKSIETAFYWSQVAEGTSVTDLTKVAVDDRVYIRVKLAANTEYTIDLQENGGVDTKLLFYKEDGTDITDLAGDYTDDYEDNYGHSIITYTPEEAGVYIFALTSYEDTDSYTPSSVTCTPAPEEENPGGSTSNGYDTSSVTATAETMLEGVIAVGASGETITGAIATVTPTLSGNRFAITKGYVASDTELAVAEATITETESSVTISTGYISEELSYNLGSGDSVDLSFITAGAGDIRSGKIGADTSGNPITGTLNVSSDSGGAEGGTGSGAFDLVKITEYIPATPAVTAISSVEVSGISLVAENDMSVLNGTYNVTDETSANTDWKDRVYKHSSADYYLRYVQDEFEADTGWYLEDVDGYDILVYFANHDIVDETVGWMDWETGNTIQVTTEVNETVVVVDAVPATLKGVKASTYSDGNWTFETTEMTFTSFDVEPRVDSIYFYAGSALIGDAVVSVASIPTDGLIFHAPLASQVASAETGQALTYSGTFTFTEFDGTPCVQLNSGYIKTSENIGISGQAPRTYIFWGYPTQYDNYSNAVGSGATQEEGRLFNCCARQDNGKILAQFTAWYDDISNAVGLADEKLHFFAYVYGGGDALVIYFDDKATINTVSNIDTQDSPLWMGCSGGNEGSYEYDGYLAGVRVYNRALAVHEIEAIFNQGAK